MIQLVRCQGDKCKSEQEIDEFIESHVLIVVLNQDIYHEEAFGEETITTEGKQHYINLSAFEPKLT